MTTSIVKIERTSGSIGRPSVAPGPSGGVYFAEGSNSTGIAHISRLDSAGAVVWTKEITISAATSADGITPNIYSSSDHLAVVLRYYETAGSVYKTSVVLYQSDGTLVWEKTVPVSIERQPALCDSTTSDGGIGGLVLAEDESVYMTGMLSSNTQLALVKLNGSDGSLAWVVDLYPSTGARTGDFNVELGLLSGGDVIATFYGADGTYSNDRTYIQRISATDGSDVWTRKVFWSNGDTSAGAAIGIDPSDNIYIGYPQASSSDYPTILKLDSSGATLWLRSVQTSLFGLFGALRLSATSAGVYMGYGQSATQGHIFFDASGTTGANLGIKTSYAAGGGTAAFETHGSRAAGSQLLMAASYTASGTARAAIILSDSTTTADNGLWGGIYTRSTTTHTVAAASGTIVVSTPSYTRPSAPSLTLAASSISESSGGLTPTVLSQAVVCTATGRASTLLFGLPVVPGVQLPYTVSTLFGTPDGRNRGLYATGKPSGLVFGTAVGQTTYTATGLAPTVAFGTPVADLNAEVETSGIASTLAFGLPLSVRGVGPAPIGLASSVDPTLTFGTAAAQSVLNAIASGWSGTVIPEARSGWGLYAAGLAAATAFGTAAVRANGLASGFKSTVFGVPTARVPILAEGFSSTVFGTPRLGNKLTAVATGWSSTALGTPATRGASRTRGAKFRTTFGSARAERTAP